MTKTLRSSTVISARVSSDTKARFAALAVRHQLSESGLLAKMVDEVLKANVQITRESCNMCDMHDSTDDEIATDRITLRLRIGDRRLAAERARVRGMKTSTYLAMLIHNHVRDAAVLPPDELDQIRMIGARLAALGRQLPKFGMPNSSAATRASVVDDLLLLTRREVEAARQATAAVVRQNLISWETGSEASRA